MAPPKTRLDPLVQWKEREMETARAQLAERLKALAEAREVVLAREATLAGLSSAITSSDEADLLERAAARARVDIARAAEAVKAATAALEKSQLAYVQAHRRLETFRRANERQRTALIAEIEREERRTLDELANLLRKP
jgi:flagellar export protein FliJ